MNIIEPLKKVFDSKKPILCVQADTLMLIKECTSTKQPYYVVMSPQQYSDYFQNNMKVQDVFPNFTAAQREFVITSTTPGEWSEMFMEDIESEADMMEQANHETNEHLEQ